VTSALAPQADILSPRKRSLSVFVQSWVSFTRSLDKAAATPTAKVV